MARSDNADPEPTSSAPQGRPDGPPSDLRSDRRHRALARVFSVGAVVVTLAAAAGLVWQISAMAVPQTGTFTFPEAYPPAEPAEILAGADQDAPVPDLESVLPDLTADERFDGELSAVFADVATGEVLFEQNGANPLAPASSMKVVTAVAALRHLGPEFRIPTRVVEGGVDDSVVLVGGGDITLTVDGEGYYGKGPSLTELAEQVLESRDGVAPTTVVLDDGLFADSTRAEGVPAGDLVNATAPMASIMVDGGRRDNTEKYAPHFPDPAMEAAEVFADLLGATEVVRGTAAQGAEELGAVHSKPVASLVDSFVISSDNALADAVGLLTGLAVEGEMTWAALSAAHRATLEELGVATDGLVFHDGSGLSPKNRMTANAFVELLVGAADSEARGVFESLPVAGHSGTVRDRFEGDDEAWGVVRAKTGTLTGVSSMTGSLTTADGRLLVYSLISNGHSNGWVLEQAADDLLTAVARCGC